MKEMITDMNMSVGPIRCQSFSTRTADSYEAGIEMGEAFQALRPEVILLFASIRYDFVEFFEALYTGLGTQSVLIIGATGDGVYETGMVSSNGIAGMAIHGGGSIRWSLALREDAWRDPYEAARQCAGQLVAEHGEPLRFALVFADKNCDGVRVVEGAGEVLTIPFGGGLAGDDWQFKRGFVFANGRALENAVCMLGMSGDFAFAINTASGWKPIGKIGMVEEVQGSTLRYIEGKTAFDFLDEQSGSVVADASLGVFTLAAYESPQSDHFFLRTADKIMMESGEVSYFGSIREGTPVRVCNATTDDVVNGVSEAILGLGPLTFEPEGAVVISCGARKWLLRDRVGEETARLFDQLGTPLPLVGFPSYGEIGPLRRADGTYTPVFFHNVSYVLFLFGRLPKETR